MKVLVTGGNGFIARNLLVHLKERKDIEVSLFVRGDDLGTLNRKVAEADCIFHLAGVNRPRTPRSSIAATANLPSSCVMRSRLPAARYRWCIRHPSRRSVITHMVSASSRLSGP